jgi:hypothetical protein
MARNSFSQSCIFIKGRVNILIMLQHNSGWNNSAMVGSTSFMLAPDSTRDRKVSIARCLTRTPD